MTPSFGHLRTEPPGFVKYVPAIIFTGIPSRKPVCAVCQVGALRGLRNSTNVQMPGS
jgi:hypothetical protein